MTLDARFLANVLSIVVIDVALAGDDVVIIVPIEEARAV